MMFANPGEQVLLPLFVSVRSDTAQLLYEMAAEMEISIDEIFSDIAEEAVIGLSRGSTFLEDVFIPDRCSTEDLLRSLKCKKFL